MTVEETTALLRPENGVQTEYGTDGRLAATTADVAVYSAAAEDAEQQQPLEPNTRTYLKIVSFKFWRSGGNRLEYSVNLALAFQILPMSIGIFLSAMDGTVVVTSYAAIGSEMKQLQNTSWIATSYLLTVTAFQ